MALVYLATAATFYRTFECLLFSFFIVVCGIYPEVILLSVTDVIQFRSVSIKICTTNRIITYVGLKCNCKRKEREDHH